MLLTALLAGVLAAAPPLAACEDDPLRVLPGDAALVMPTGREVTLSGSGPLRLEDDRVDLSAVDGLTLSVDGRVVTAPTDVGAGSVVTVADGQGHVLWTLTVGDADDEGARAFMRPSGQDDPARRWAQAFSGQGSSTPGVDAALDEALQAYQGAFGAMADAPVVVGITTVAPDPSLAARQGLDPDRSLVVAEVRDGYPAKAAGLRPGDVILGADGSDGVTQDSLRAAVRSHEAGEPVTLVLSRDGERLTVDVPVRVAGPAWGGLGMGTSVGEGPAADAERMLADLNQKTALKAKLKASLEALRNDATVARQAQDELRAQLQGTLDQTRRLAKQAAGLAAQRGSDEEQASEQAGASRKQLEALAQELARAQERMATSQEALAHMEQESAARQQALAAAAAVAAQLGQDPDDPFDGLAVLGRGSSSGQTVLFPPRVPAPDAVPEPDLDARLSRLEQRLERLETLLQQLADRSVEGSAR